MNKLMIAACLAAMLGGCAQVGQITAADATQAAAINPANAACYQAIATVGMAVGAATQPGLLTVIATKIAGQGALQSADCAPVEAMVLGEILKATPIAPLVP